MAEEVQEFVRRTLFKQFVLIDQSVCLQFPLLSLYYQLVLGFNGNNLKFRVLGIDAVDSKSLLEAAASGKKLQGTGGSSGIITPTTAIELKKASGSVLKLSGSATFYTILFFFNIY